MGTSKRVTPPLLALLAACHGTSRPPVTPVPLSRPAAAPAARSTPAAATPNAPQTDPHAAVAEPSCPTLLARSVALANGAACAVLPDATVACWGYNAQYGTLGDGTRENRTRPVRVPGLAGVAEVAMGGGHACARLALGEVWCWGNSADGQTGSPIAEPALRPAQVSGLRDAVALAAGGSHTCAVRRTGAVVCWGRNAEGQLGDGTTRSRSRPAPVLGIAGATQVAAGGHHACALTRTGQAWCWGPYRVDGLEAQPFRGARARRLHAGGDLRTIGSTPAGEFYETGRFRRERDLDRQPVRAVGTASPTCAVRGSGGVTCWGFAWHPAPLDLPGVVDAEAVAIAAGRICVRRAAGPLSCVEARGGGPEEQSPPPFELAAVDAPIATARDLALGGDRGCAVSGEGGVACWGDGSSGALGDGTSGYREAAGPVSAIGCGD